MPRATTALILAAVLAALPLPGCSAGVSGAMVVRTPPPPPRAEVRPPAPGPAHVWVPGHWRWNGRRYVWVRGHWKRPPRPGAVWVPGHWIRRGGGWLWVPGHWRR